MPDDQPLAVQQGLLHKIWLYLQANPSGKDTVEGIQEWWIPNGKQRFSKDEMQQALDFAVTRGWMQRSMIGTTALYSTTELALKKFSGAVNELGWKK